MTSESQEQPLLHEPDLMLAVLRTGARGRATVEDCVGHLQALLRMAHEPPPDDLAELRGRLDEVQGKLRRAGLIRMAAPDGFEITERGRRVLEDHPDGVDESLLMRFPEYRAAIAGPAGGGGMSGQDLATWDAGYAAYFSGRALADNPHAADRRDHLEWENGWSQARDDALRASRGRA